MRLEFRPAVPISPFVSGDGTEVGRVLPDEVSTAENDDPGARTSMLPLRESTPSRARGSDVETPAGSSPSELARHPIELAERLSGDQPLPFTDERAETSFVPPWRRPMPWVADALVVALCLALVGGCAALLTVGPVATDGPIRKVGPSALVVLVLAATFVAAKLVPVPFHHRGGSYLSGLAEVPLLVGLVFASPRALVLACVASDVVVFGLLHRQSPAKLLLNIAAGAFSVALAATVFRVVLGDHSPAGPALWGAGLAALAAAALCAAEAVGIGTMLYGNRPHRQLTSEALLFLASAGLGFVVVDAAWWDAWATLPLLLVCAAVVIAYRGYSRLSVRFGALQRLYAFSRSLGVADLEPSGMSLAVLEQVKVIMRARRAEIVLSEPSGIPRRVSLDEDGGSKVEPVVIDDGSIVARAIDQARAQLYPRQRQVPRDDPVLGEYREAVAAPLRDAESVVGALVAMDREDNLEPFDAEDRHLFEALAVHASSSLDRARLVEELRYEVESKSYQATHDPLTGLANRTLFLNRATGALDGSQRVGIVLLDLDRFKDVNATLGHALGDRLLREISERLSRAMSGHRAFVARLGGDEFALVLSDITGPEEATGIIRDLNDVVFKPVNIDGISLAVSASAGIALFPEQGPNVEALLQRADIAMYLAKHRRSGIEVYSATDDQTMQRRLMLGGELVHALDTGKGLSVVYQPIADLSTGDVVSVEALTRWHHPEHGSIPADEFIDIAEQIGIIGQVTDFVLDEACARLARWRAAGFELGISVNLSGMDLSDPCLVHRVQERLWDNRLSGHVLTLEMTETEVMADLGHASNVLNELADLGVRIAVDDYGTGYSSLAYLHRLPVKELKIDRSFVTNLTDDPSNTIIVRSSVAMAHSLGLTAVAEGAEDELSCRILAEAECDAVQGYFLSRPQEPDHFFRWLEDGGRLRVLTS